MRQKHSFAQHSMVASGLPVHYIEAGTGDLIVLIHGSLCDFRYWRWQMDAFSHSFRVVAPSLPGCWPEALSAPASGQHAYSGYETCEPVQEGPYGMPQHVRAIVDLCRQLSPGRRVRLLGHSRGAQVAMEAALAMPGHIERLVLADPGFPFTDEAPIEPVHAQIASRLGTAPLDEVVGEFVDAVNGRGTWGRTVSWFKEMVRDNAWTLLAQLNDIHRSLDPKRIASTVRFPVLLVQGEYSPARYVSRIELLMSLITDVQHVVVPAAAHGMNLANARYFNESVLSFLCDDNS